MCNIAPHCFPPPPGLVHARWGKCGATMGAQPREQGERLSRYCCRQNSAMRTDVNATREHVETEFMIEDVLHRETGSLSSSFDSDSVYAEDSCCCYFPVVHYNSVHVPGAVQPSLDVG